MALNIKNVEVECLVGEVASLAGETKTEAVRQALLERRERLALQVPKPRRGDEFMRYLEEEFWPNVPPELLGRKMTKEEKEAILGYGPDGF